MSLFRQEIQRIVDRSVPRLHTQRGIIPKGGVNYEAWTCTIRCADPNQGASQGVHPGGGNYLEFHDVPMPRQLDGVIHSPKAKIFEQDCGVLIGFKGHESFPYIIQFLDIYRELDGKPRTEVSSRQPVVTQNFLTDGSASLGMRGGGGTDYAPPARDAPVAPAPTPPLHRPTGKTEVMRGRSEELARGARELVGRFWKGAQ